MYVWKGKRKASSRVQRRDSEQGMLTASCYRVTVYTCHPYTGRLRPEDGCRC